MNKFRYEGPITIICANSYWKPEGSRFRYVLEFRSMFDKYSKPARLTPKWALEAEHYALGFYAPRYKVPMTVTKS